MVAPQLRMLQVRAEMAGRRRPRRGSQARVPTAIAQDFLRALLDVLQEQQDLVVARVTEQLGRSFPSTPLRQDGPGDVVKRLMQAVRGELGDLESPSASRKLEAALLVFVGRINAASATQTNKAIKKVAGVDVFTTAPGLNDLSELFVAENISLINALRRDHLDGVEQVVLRGIRDGSRNEVIAKTLADRFGIAKKRAALIATDQVNKLFGQVQQARQVGLGVEEYIWRTAGDSRVRSRHADRDGKVFRWDSPPEGGHPGQPVRCRCTAEPVIPGLTSGPRT